MFINIPVDINALQISSINAVEPVVNGNGEQRRDYTNIRMWQLVVTAKIGRDYEAIPIQFSQDDEPKWDGSQSPVVHGLTVRPWANLNDRKKLKGGLMWTAQSVGFGAAAREKAAA